MSETTNVNEGLQVISIPQTILIDNIDTDKTLNVLRLNRKIYKK